MFTILKASFLACNFFCLFDFFSLFFFEKIQSIKYFFYFFMLSRKYFRGFKSLLIFGKRILLNLCVQTCFWILCLSDNSDVREVITDYGGRTFQIFLIFKINKNSKSVNRPIESEPTAQPSQSPVCVLNHWFGVTC